MSGGEIDLESYFDRIAYVGPRAPALDTLAAIHAAHVAAIPFENLDVLLGRPIRLDPASLARKLVTAHRGGYCYEQNGLLLQVLTALGFAVTPLAARVRLGALEGVETARSHMLLAIDLPEGRFLADVGFGGQNPCVPLRLEAGPEQPTSNGLYRVMPHDDGGLLPNFELQARGREGWSSLYRFTLEPQRRIDYEVSNWWVSTHPDSIFVRSLMVARAERDRRYTLLGGNFSIRNADGRAEEWPLANADALVGVLKDYFGLDPARIAEENQVPEARMRDVLARCIVAARQITPAACVA